MIYYMIQIRARRRFTVRFFPSGWRNGEGRWKVGTRRHLNPASTLSFSVGETRCPLKWISLFKYGIVLLTDTQSELLLGKLAFPCTKSTNRPPDLVMSADQKDAAAQSSPQTLNLPRVPCCPFTRPINKDVQGIKYVMRRLSLLTEN